MRRTIGAILVSGAVLAMSAAVGVAQTQVSLPKIEESHLVVEAWASVEVPADTVVVKLLVMGEAATLAEAKAAHLSLVGAISGAVQGTGIVGDAIKSLDYSSRQNTRWDEQTQTEVKISHQVSSRVEITTTDFELVPRIIEAAVGAGASRVTGFDFSSTKESEARILAIEKATGEAKRDAAALASGAGVSLTRLRGVFLDPSSYESELGIPSPVRSGGGGPMFGSSVFRDSAQAEALVFQPEPVEVRATVRLVYETKPNE